MSQEQFPTHKGDKGRDYIFEIEEEKEYEEKLKIFFQKILLIEGSGYFDNDGQEYIALSDMHRVYEEIFGVNTIAYNTLRYRIQVKIKNAENGIYVNDLRERSNEPKYYLDPTKTRLLKSIFSRELFTGIPEVAELKSRVKDLEGGFAFLNNLDDSRV